MKLYLKEQLESRRDRAPGPSSAGSHHHHHHHNPFGHHHQAQAPAAAQLGTYKEMSSAIDEPNSLQIPVVPSLTHQSFIQSIRHLTTHVIIPVHRICHLVSSCNITQIALIHPLGFVLSFVSISRLIYRLLCSN